MRNLYRRAMIGTVLALVALAVPATALAGGAPGGVVNM